MPSTVLGAGDIWMNKVDKDSSANMAYVLDQQQCWGGEIINIVNKSNTLTSHPLGWLQWKKQVVTSIDKGTEKLELLGTVGKNVTWCSHNGKQYGRYSKIKKQNDQWCRNSTSEYIPIRIESRVLKRYLNTYVHGSSIRNGRTVETTEVPIARWVSEQNTADTYNVILFSFKK